MNKNKERWVKNYTDLVKYYKKHGDTIVPVKEQLGDWLRRQRILEKSGILNEVRRSKLLSIHPQIFQSNEDQSWEYMFDELAKFNADHPKRKIPNGVPYNELLLQPLRFWCDKQLRDARDYSKSNTKWANERKDKWENRRIRLEERVNFQFNDNLASPMKEELFRLINNFERTYNLEFLELLKERKSLKKEDFERSPDPENVDYSEVAREELLGEELLGV